MTKAIQVVGTRSIYDLVLAYGVANAFKDINTGVVDLERYWEQAATCALLSKYLAEELGVKEPEKLFVCGLLQNIGELVLVQLDSEIALKCVAISIEDTPLRLQKKHLGFSYADISADLLTLWGIPQDISQIVANTHASEKHAESVEQKILQLAYVMALNDVNNETYGPYDGVTEDMLQGLSLEKADIDNALDFSHLQLMNTLALFSPNSFAMF